MRLKEDLGKVARTLYVLFGLVLVVATLATAWQDWPLILTRKISPVTFGLTMFIALPISCLIIVWACIGRHKEWYVKDDHIAIEFLSLTSWRKTIKIKASDIDSLALESVAYEDRANHTVYWLKVKLKDGKHYDSPKSFERSLVEGARDEIELLKQKS